MGGLGRVLTLTSGSEHLHSVRLRRLGDGRRECVSEGCGEVGWEGDTRVVVPTFNMQQYEWTEDGFFFFLFVLLCNFAFGSGSTFNIC